MSNRKPRYFFLIENQWMLVALKKQEPTFTVKRPESGSGLNCPSTRGQLLETFSSRANGLVIITHFPFLGLNAIFVQVDGHCNHVLF